MTSSKFIKTFLYAASLFRSYLSLLPDNILCIFIFLLSISMVYFNFIITGGIIDLDQGYSLELAAILEHSKSSIPRLFLDDGIFTEFMESVYSNKSSLTPMYFENIIWRIQAFMIFSITIQIMFLGVLLWTKNNFLLLKFKFNAFIIVLYVSFMVLIGFFWFNYVVFSHFCILNKLNIYLVNYLDNFGYEYGIGIFYPVTGEKPYLIFLEDWVGAFYIVTPFKVPYSCSQLNLLDMGQKPYLIFLKDSLSLLEVKRDYTKSILLGLGIILFIGGLAYLKGGFQAIHIITEASGISKLAIISSKTAAIAKQGTIFKSLSLAKGIMAKATVLQTLSTNFTKLPAFINGNGGHTPLTGVVQIDVNVFLEANKHVFIKLSQDIFNSHVL